ncbi:competence protein ComJ [Pelistega indica]|uniref:Ribosomal RNA large subunit methyltransferase J n=1 Tax=Pelistega indica TaxID=1414851 RepID=V8G907_9BURK|nr:23S rRNA (adenine(2030)-N(6))-methyltransferase RlmJ [Pelistega indica]ETD72576.1 competence protein ComJ [Pelistega indica]
MFSYRHAFHAGNHADVLKHTVLIHTLDYFNRKPTPYWVIDTHAGAGIYDLADKWAEKNAEFETGISRLFGRTDLPEDLATYVQYIKELNLGEDLQFYPGSPWIALEYMRDKDKLRLFELHPSEVEILTDNIQQQDAQIRRQVSIFEKNGFEYLKSQLPPPTRRAITLIDPSYEDKHDYRHVIKAMKEGLERFQTGCYLIWYPLVQRKEVYDMVQHLQKLPNIEWINASLTIKKPSKDGYGMHGSGMFVINPPYTLYPALEQILPYLKEHLAEDAHALYTLEHVEK